MKIDKRRPGHWLLLGGFLVTCLAGLMLRIVKPRAGRNLVLFYGHKLNGNLLPVYRTLAAAPATGLQPVFVTMDRSYCQSLGAAGFRAVWACGPRAARSLASATALISDHGLHSLGPLVGAYQRQSLRFFDVWHGIPFKGFDADDFRLQHRYDETWAASPLLKKLYIERFGFDADKVVVTGYARTDRLVRQDEDVQAIRHGLGLDASDAGKVILFAPTWKQDARQHSIYPFGTDEHRFLGALSELAQRTCSTIVMRTHLNSGPMATAAWQRIVQRPSADYPDTEALLLASDILVCDWSSIAFDWLLLDRPTIFLDVEPPFAKGLALAADNRYGELVSDMDALVASVRHCLEQPDAYREGHGQQANRVRERVYGDCADSAATRRCVERLRACTGSQSLPRSAVS